MMIEDQRKHLDSVGSTISRLAGNSFQLKAWSVGLGSAIIGLTAGAQAKLAWLALIPVITFWSLDGYYLALERLYRRLYERIAVALRSGDESADGAPALYDMRVDGPHRDDWLEAMTAPAVVYLHLAIALAAVVVTVVGLLRPDPIVK